MHRDAVKARPDKDNAHAIPAKAKQASAASKTGLLPRPSDIVPAPPCPRAKPTMKRDKVRPDTVSEVPSARGKSGSVGALRSTARAGRPASSPSMTVKEYEFGL